MQTVRFLHAALAQALPTVHARRLTALMCSVAALLHGRCLTLTGLGRAMPGTALEDMEHRLRYEAHQQSLAAG